MHVSSESTICGMNQEYFCSIILFDSLNKENMNLNPFYQLEWISVVSQKRMDISYYKLLV